MIEIHGVHATRLELIQSRDFQTVEHVIANAWQLRHASFNHYTNGDNGDKTAHSKSDKIGTYAYRVIRNSDLDPAHTTTVTSTTKGGS